MIPSREKSSITDDTGKTTSMSPEEEPNERDDTLTDEEWIDYSLDRVEPQERYRMRCIRCGYDEEIPVWIVSEFAGEDRTMGKKWEVALECPRCNGAMYRKK